MTRSAVPLSAFLIAVAAFAPAAASDPVAPTCNGRVPTITAAAPGVVQGTAEADVILVTGTAPSSAAATTGPVTVLAGAGDDVVCVPNNGANVVDGGDGLDLVSYEHAGQLVVASMNAAAVRLNVALTTVPPQTAPLDLAPSADLLPRTEHLIGGPYADVLIGHLLNPDRIAGAGGDDVIVGLFGNDHLLGEAGNDLLVGDGADEFVYGPFDGITVGTVTTPVLATDDDLLEGGAGDDSVSDETGNNVLLGGAGTDGLAGGFGTDTIDGGTGADHVSYSQRAVRLDLNVTGPQDTNHGIDTVRGIEHVTGSDENDILIGTPGENVLRGDGGDDRIAGSLSISTAEDRLFGDDGIDVCHGRGRSGCECPNAAEPLCSTAPYDWTPSDGVGA